MSKNKRLKKLENHVKIRKDDIVRRRGSDCDQFPTFSFLHLTTNKRHNFNYLTEQIHQTKAILYDRLEEISQHDWKYWLSQPKKTGLEVLPYDRMRFSPKSIQLANDENIYVFRFYQNQYRILGIRKEKCPVFYIIAYDFDHSAYDHGS